MVKILPCLHTITPEEEPNQTCQESSLTKAQAQGTVVIGKKKAGFPPRSDRCFYDWLPNGLLASTNVYHVKKLQQQGTRRPDVYKDKPKGPFTFEKKRKEKSIRHERVRE